MRVSHEMQMRQRKKNGIRLNKLTNTHQHQEASQESPKISDCITRTVHEIIRICASSANPIRYRSDDICRNHNQRKEVVPKSGGEDDQKKANGKNLKILNQYNTPPKQRFMMRGSQRRAR